MRFLKVESRNCFRKWACTLHSIIRIRPTFIDPFSFFNTDVLAERSGVGAMENRVKNHPFSFEFTDSQILVAFIAVDLVYRSGIQL